MSERLEDTVVQKTNPSPRPAPLLTATGALCVLLASAACGGGASTRLVDGGTLTMAVPSDPGNLDPHGSPSNVNLQLARFAYDALVAQTPNGEIKPQLATRWEPVRGGYAFTLRKGVTCSDGSAMTPSAAAENFNYIQRPTSRSPLYGGVIPPGLRAKGDDAAGTVTLTTAKPFPFLLQAASSLPLVCRPGLANRSLLKNKTSGTGPYVLSEMTAGNTYTYTRRQGYAWGPDGATTSARGLPAKVVFKVVANETTAANLLLGGQVNVASVAGPDRQRLKAGRLFDVTTRGPLGEMFFNQGDGRPGRDERVRRALAAGADLGQVGKVLSGGYGVASSGLVTISPKPCQGNTAQGNVPTHDLTAAQRLLDEAGWTAGADGRRTRNGTPLTLTLLYDPALVSNASAAAELLAQQWKRLGADVRLNAQPVTQIQALTATGAFDAVWLPLQANYPTMIMPFLAGPKPPKGLNFSHIDNKEYAAATAAALAKPVATGCADWNRAEAALFRAADVVPFVDRTLPTWGKNATFQVVAGAIAPLSLRLTAS